MKIKNKSTMNKTQLKNLNKMSDRKNLTKNAEQKDSGEQRRTKKLECEQRGTRTITIGLCAKESNC